MASKALSSCLEEIKDEFNKAPVILSILLIVIIWSWLKLLRMEQNKEMALLPPGPLGLPLLGNLPFLDRDLHRYFTKLSEKYGPVVKIQLGRRLAIVFSTPEVAKEVLKDQDINFADRDIPALASIGISGLAFLPYGEHLRILRKVCVRELLSHRRLEALYGLRRREVHEMVKRIQSNIGVSIDIGEYVLLAMFNTITIMIWGNTLDGEERRYVTTEFRKVANKIVALVGAPNISDIFPVLAPFDIQGKARRMKENLMWFDQIFEFVINQRNKLGIQEEKNKDFLQVMLQLIEQTDQKTRLTIEHLKALFLDLTVAGTKTTSTTVEWAMAELLNQPKILKKLQEELAQVVGLNNVVEESHLPKLPYLAAVAKEVLRLHPTAPLLIPRCPRESCVIGGYLIPKGAKIFVNAWAIQRDSKYWNDPLEFRPERFLNSSLECDYSGNDFRYIPFGSGRRVCVGIPIAEKLVSYLLASLMHSFNWKLPEGVELDLSEKFGIELQKKIPLKAIPTPRLCDPDLYK